MSSMSPPMLEQRDAVRGTASPACPPQWASVARRRVYFGHQSVGRDIIAGLESLSAEHSLGMRFVQTRDPSVLSGPAFVDFIAGENTRPATKNRALLEQLDARPFPDGAIAILKYCYVDIDERTDVRRIFDDYRRMIGVVRECHPDVTAVHVTVPLTSSESVMKWRIKKVLARPTLRGANRRRTEYNALMRSAFAGKGPLFDLAAVEASRDAPAGAGKRAVRGIEALDENLTYDGGHLNAVGARRAAAALLDVLGALAPQTDG